MNDLTSFKTYYDNLLKQNLNISGKFFNDKKMRHFPELYNDWKSSNNKNEFIYDLLFDITEKPVCEICGKQVRLKSFKEGYRRFCSNTCVNKFNSTSSEFSQKISDSMARKFNDEYYMQKYKFVTKKDKENFLVSNYCVHGDFLINKNKFQRLMTSGGEICEKCIDEFALASANTDLNIHKYSNEIPYKQQHPNEWKAIEENCIEVDASFSEKKYMLKIGISSRPICEICHVRKRKFIGANIGFTQTCADPECIHASSVPEQEIFKIVKNLFEDSISRYKIDKEEIDIYVPSLKVGIEFNGLYWHSEKFKHYRWHLKKMSKLRNAGIRIMIVWEDDWRKKRNIVISQILNMLGQSMTIQARKTTVTEISKQVADDFLNMNHLQGTCNASHRFGLFYDNDLVSVMMFGKKRMIFHSRKEEEYELLRFSNKMKYSVTGGASKLFSYFVKSVKPTSVVSYANSDISDGNLYKKLGFVQSEITYPGYWWCKDGEKHHRSNFMKQKIAITPEDRLKTGPQIMQERGYYRVWNAGNLKFTWKAAV